MYKLLLLGFPIALSLLSSHCLVRRLLLASNLPNHGPWQTFRKIRLQILTQIKLTDCDCLLETVKITARLKMNTWGFESNKRFLSWINNRGDICIAFFLRMLFGLQLKKLSYFIPKI